MDNKKDFTNDPLLTIEIMKNISEGIYLVRIDDGSIVYANERFEEMFGYESGELIGKDVNIINAPTDKTPEETKKVIVDILLKNAEWHGEVENIKKDGTQFWCYANASLLNYSEFGQVILAVHTDITEKIVVEKELLFKISRKSSSVVEMFSLLSINFEFPPKTILPFMVGKTTTPLLYLLGI